MASYQVRFTAGTLSTGQENSFGLVGKGEADFTAGIAIRGRKRSFLWSAPFTLQLYTTDVRNVECKDKAVRFEVGPAPDRKPGHVTLFAENEAAAQEIAARLPKTQTPEFTQARQEQVEFESRLRGRVSVTPALVAANLVVFIAMAVNGVGLLRGDGEALIRWGSNFGPLTADGQWWRLFTATFLHSGLLHVGFNMWALYESGKLAERLFGAAQFLLLYVVAGLLGSVASLLWNPAVNSVGASGAVFGVYGALLAYMLNRANGVPLSVMKQQRTSALGFIVYTLGYGVSHAGIDNAAHVGGLVGGLLMGFVLARPLDPQRRPDGRRQLATGLAIAAVALPLLAMQVKNMGPQFQAEQAYRADVNWFIGEEDRLVKAWLAQRERLKDPLVSDTAHADAMDRDLVRPWGDAHERLARHALGPDSGLKTHQQILLRYTGSRRDAFKALASSIRTNDASSRGTISALFKSGDTAIQQLKDMAAKKGAR